jgi:conjugative transfer signal peptidase TraF
LTRKAVSETRKGISPLLYVGVLLLVGALLAYGLGVRFTLTPSIPRGLYLYTDDSLAVGRLATFCPPEEVTTYSLERGYLHRGGCPGDVEPLGKYVLATAGDTVSITAEGLAVNGRAVPGSAVYYRDRVGRKLPHVPFGRHVVGADSLFMFSGHHPLSFDSRYFGPIPASSVISTMRPLWTVE